MIKRSMKYLAMILFLGCEQTVQPDVYSIEVDARLRMDRNGYYHLMLDRTRNQTLHRISGHIYGNGYALESNRVEWRSSHYWILSDSIGYIYDKWRCEKSYGCECVYLGRDTTYITYFSGYEVPTINRVSYSDRYGEINTMFAPVQRMIGDTVRVELVFYNTYVVNIILE